MSSYNNGVCGKGRPGNRFEREKKQKCLIRQNRIGARTTGISASIYLYATLEGRR